MVTSLVVGDLDVRVIDEQGVTIRYGADVARAPELLAGFERIVVATGARYRWGMGPAARAMLDLGAGHWPGLRRIFSSPRFRDWFYFRARAATGARFAALARPGQEVVVIGDARRAGKSKDAIASAFDAAYGIEG